MAYSALVSLAQLIEQILLYHQDYTYIAQKQQIQSFHSHIIFLKELFDDFPGDCSSMIQHLESQIIDIAYHAENIISSDISDRTTFHNVSENGENILSLREMFSTFESCVEEVNSIVEDATEIRKILEMKKGVAVLDSLTTTTSSPSGAPSGKDIKVGLDTALMQIRERLVGHNRQLQIIPIVGMGGLGKTTLARSVIDDPKVVSHFDFRIWVTISQDYNKQRILQAILSVSDPKAGVVTEQLLFERVYKSLNSRRFLIIFDDIWDAKAWESVMNALPDDKQGSRVILTTRLSEVAVKVDSSSPIYHMQLLNEDQSWDLLQKEVFGQRPCPPRLEKAGKIIAENCKGLPLAIVVIAGLLKHNHAQNHWEKYANSINRAAALTHDEELIGILSLSYDNLPHHLKACFLYMSLFPEDDEIPCIKLVWIWVAEGFLKPKKDKSMEEVAEECLVDLVKRNLITACKKRSNGRVRTCSIHDVLRELSLRKSKEEKFSRHEICKNTHANSKVNSFNHFRIMLGRTFNPPMSYLFRLGLNNGAIFPSPQGNVYYEPVRSLLIPHLKHLPLPSLQKFRLIRVLDALQLDFHIGDFQIITDSLVHLRYLALTFHCCTVLKSSHHHAYPSRWFGAHPELDLQFVRNLKNVDTLILKHNCRSNIYMLDVRFPILELPKLRHFVLIEGDKYMSGVFFYHPEDYRYYHIHEPLPSSGLWFPGKLQTISGIDNLKLTSIMVQSLENLVKLKIKYINVNLDECCLDQLVHLHQLQVLSLDFDNYQHQFNIRLPMNITFPVELKKLTLMGLVLEISSEEMSVFGLLPNLEGLKLDVYWYGSRECETNDGEFQKLKYLNINLRNVHELKFESSHFPCLEHLVIGHFPYLKEVPMELWEINTLRKLVIRSTDKNVYNSALKIQEEQRKYDNYDLEVIWVVGGI